VIAVASFRRTFFLTRVPKGTIRFLMRRLASLIYYLFTSKKNTVAQKLLFANYKYINKIKLVEKLNS
jgi:hypothetical protein